MIPHVSVNDVYSFVLKKTKKPFILLRVTEERETLTKTLKVHHGALHTLIHNPAEEPRKQRAGLRQQCYWPSG